MGGHGLSPFLRMFWGLTLCFFLAGCTGYSQLGLPGNMESVGEPDEGIPVVEVGQYVKIVLVDGTTFEGEVISVSKEDLVLGKPGNYGFEEMVFKSGEIAEIQTQTVPGWVSGVALGTAIFVTLVIVLASQIKIRGSLD